MDSTILLNGIAGLAEKLNPPTARFKNLRQIRARISELEKNLGISKGQDVLTINHAMLRLSILEDAAAAHGPSTTSLSLPAKASAADPAPPMRPPPAAPQPPADTGAAIPAAGGDSKSHQAARLACQRDRIAGALPTLRGIDLECARAKIAALNAKIAKLK